MNSNDSSSGSSPVDTVKGYFAAMFTGQGDTASFLCSTFPDATKQRMQAGFDPIKSAFTAGSATLDISGLTYTEQNVNGDSGQVVVEGKIKVIVFGVSREKDFPSWTIPVKLENGIWKVCFNPSKRFSAG